MHANDAAESLRETLRPAVDVLQLNDDDDDDDIKIEANKIHYGWTDFNEMWTYRSLLPDYPKTEVNVFSISKSVRQYEVSPISYLIKSLIFLSGLVGDLKYNLSNEDSRFKITTLYKIKNCFYNLTETIFQSYC